MPAVPERVHHPPDLIYSPGTQVVTLRPVIGHEGRTLHPRGAVGVVIRSPCDLDHAYRVRFPDGVEESLRRGEVLMLAEYQEQHLAGSPAAVSPALVAAAADRGPLFQRLVYRCIVGSRAYGLDDEQSDTDYRGIFLPTAEQHWSLCGVPDQIECHETQEHYWEVQRFLVLALKANPNVLECLYTPLVEQSTPWADELLRSRKAFLSQLVYQTYNGYVMSQFKKMQADLRQHGAVKWKHVMHLIRLLISGVTVLREGYVPVRVEEHRDELLAIKRGEMPWEETEHWRLRLHAEFDAALAKTSLPDRPDYERANALLLQARRGALADER